MRGPSRAADGDDVPAGPQAGQHDMNDQRKDCRRKEADRKTHKVAEGEVVPDLGSDRGRTNLLRIAQKQAIHDCADHDQSDQRGQEGAQAQVAYEDAVDEANQRARDQRERHRDPERQAGPAGQNDDHEVGQREHRADAEVDAAGHHDDGQTKAHQQVFPDRLGKIAEVCQREQVRHQRAEDRKQDRQHQDRNGVVDPRLGEDLSHNVVGDQSVAPAHQGVAFHRLARLAE